MRSRTTTCPSPTSPAWSTSCPSGTAAVSFPAPTVLLDSVVGGWQISAINTAQAGTPFNLTYTPNATQQVSPQISATYRGANEYRPDYRPWADDHAGNRTAQPTPATSTTSTSTPSCCRPSRTLPATISARSAMPRAIQAALRHSTKPTSISTRSSTPPSRA